MRGGTKVGIFRKNRTKEADSSPLLLPFYDRWAASPTDRKMIEESASWMVVDHIVEREGETKWAIGKAWWPDAPGSKEWLVRLYLTDKRLVMHRLKMTEALYPGAFCIDIPFSDVVNFRPISAKPIEFSVDIARPEGVMPLLLTFTDKDNSVRFLYTTQELIKQHGGIHGAEGDASLRELLRSKD